MALGPESIADYYDEPEMFVLVDRQQNAVYMHTCAKCQGDIVPRERYRVLVWVLEGFFDWQKSHLQCQFYGAYGAAA